MIQRRLGLRYANQIMPALVVLPSVRHCRCDMLLRGIARFFFFFGGGGGSCHIGYVLS